MTSLILAILFSTLTFVAFKLFIKYGIDNVQAISTNYLIAFLIGMLVVKEPMQAGRIIQAEWFWFALLLGLFFILVYYLFAMSSQKAGIALTSVASKMSVAIPVTLGFILYHEHMNLPKGMGILCALVALYLTLKRPGKVRVEQKYILFPLLLFAGNGTVDSMLKYAQHHLIGDQDIEFLSIVFLSAFVLGIAYVLLKKKNSTPGIKIKNIFAGMILGMLNFGSTYYMIHSLVHFESSLVFPVVNTGIVGLSALLGFLAFRERLDPVNWSGIALAIIAILLFAYA
ncbi:MAG: EamA family transporter [Bacteroidales bacterium]